MVESLAVDLDSRHTVDDEVDALPRFDEGHLTDDRVTRETEAGSRQALREGLTRGVRPVPDRTQRLRQASDQLPQVRLVEPAGVQRPVEARHGHIEWFVEYYPDEGIRNRDSGDGAAVAELPVLPAEHDATRICGREAPEPVVL